MLTTVNDGGGGWNSGDIANLIMLGSDEFLQIWGATHDTPAPAPTGQIALPGVNARFNTNYLILGLVAVAAIIYLK